MGLAISLGEWTGRPFAGLALAVVGGTIGVICFLTFFTGTEVGLQGYQALNQIGSSAFTGFISAYFNTREIAPLVAALALSATVGSGFTAQLGAMRISEEIDALEVMAVPPIPFLVTTRMIAGLAAVVPLYIVGLLTSYLATRTIATGYFGQSTGTYDYYFHLFLPPEDVLWSFGKVLVFSVIVSASTATTGTRRRADRPALGWPWAGRCARRSSV